MAGPNEDSNYQDILENVEDRLAACRSVLFITGAGMSAESGIPTYRGVSGRYNDQSTADGVSIEQRRRTFVVGLAIDGETQVVGDVVMSRIDPCVVW